MIEAKKVLCLIPARGGSKRFPGKNIKLLGGLPLIAWTIRAVLSSRACAAVVVSTDDVKIARIAKQFGATIPALRPDNLATDTATSVDVAIHELDAYEVKHGEVDALMLLQPTSPFRSADTIGKAMALYELHGGRPVVSVSPAVANPAWCFHVEREALVPIFSDERSKRCAQDLKPIYELNGAMYVVSPETLRKKRTFITEESCPLIIDDPAESLDIDTEWDWMIAEAIQRQRKSC